MRAFKFVGILFVFVLIFTSCINLKDNTDEEVEEPIITEELDPATFDYSIVTGTDKLYDGMYVIKNSFILLKPNDNSTKLAELTIGTAVNVVEYDEWCFIKILYLEGGSYEYFNGWIPKSNLGYYESLKTNIGVDVLIKKEHEPNGYQKFPNGLWGTIYKETETEFTLSTYGLSFTNVKKEHVESFFTEQ